MMVNAEGMRRDVVTLAASAGGVPALRSIIAALPSDYPGIVALVLHRSPYFVASELLQVLSGRSPHTLIEPRNNQPVERGRIYVAPRDLHLIFRNGCLGVHRGPKQHYTRPAADPLFESAASSYGARVVGVVLTGNGDDGLHGLRAIKAAGGLSIAQDPSEADSPSMPTNAIRYDHVDLVLPLSAIADTLDALARGQAI